MTASISPEPLQHVTTLQINASNDCIGNKQAQRREEPKEREEDVPISASDTDDEARDALQDVVGFGDAMKKILTQNVAQDAVPILAKRTTSRMREIQSEKKETKTLRLGAAEKRERKQKDMAVPDYSTAGQDRALRMIATKGVVALFNAIEKHQHQTTMVDDKHDKKVKQMSKDNFLGLLKASQQKFAEKSVSKSTTSSWSVVQDGFMMDAKLRDWDNQHGTEVGRVRQKGDAESEAVEELAWKQAGDALEVDSDTDVSNDIPTCTKPPTKRRMVAAGQKSKRLKQLKQA